MEKEYYLLDEDERTGPFTYHQLVKNGLDVHTQLTTTFGDKWQYASEMPEFIDYFKSIGVYFPTGDNIANFGTRAGAFIIDVLILIIPLDFIFIKTGIMVVPESLEKFTMPPTESLMMIQAIFCAVFLTYNIICEMSNWKGSIGKKICNIIIVDVDGKRPGFLQALGRNIGALLSFNLLYGLPFLSMLFLEHGQTWYDYLVKTYTVKTN